MAIHVQNYCIIHPESELQSPGFNFGEAHVEIQAPSPGAPGSSASSSSGVRETFVFDRVFPPNTPQEQVFQDVGRAPVLNALENFVSCAFIAYGGSGGGKTFAITGGAQRFTDRGIIPRSISTLFEALGARPDRDQFEVSVSFYEIYKDAVVDLLSERRRRVTVQNDNPQAGPVLLGLVKQKAAIESDAYHLLFQGDSNRHFERLPLNAETSRGHVFYVLQLTHVPSGREASLAFIDLATTISLRNHATASIARSVEALRNAIGAIRAGRQPQFETSILTQLLQPWLQPRPGYSVHLGMLGPLKYLDQQQQELHEWLHFAKLTSEALKDPVMAGGQMQEDVFAEENEVDDMMAQAYIPMPTAESTDQRRTSLGLIGRSDVAAAGQQGQSRRSQLLVAEENVVDLANCPAPQENMGNGMRGLPEDVFVVSSCPAPAAGSAMAPTSPTSAQPLSPESTYIPAVGSQGPPAEVAAVPTQELYRQPVVGRSVEVQPGPPTAADLAPAEVIVIPDGMSVDDVPKDELQEYSQVLAQHLSQGEYTVGQAVFNFVDLQRRTLRDNCVGQSSFKPFELRTAGDHANVIDVETLTIDVSMRRRGDMYQVVYGAKSMKTIEPSRQEVQTYSADPVPLPAVQAAAGPPTVGSLTSAVDAFVSVVQATASAAAAAAAAASLEVDQSMNSEPRTVSYSSELKAAATIGISTAKSSTDRVEGPSPERLKPSEVPPALVTRTGPPTTAQDVVLRGPQIMPPQVVPTLPLSGLASGGPRPLPVQSSVGAGAAVKVFVCECGKALEDEDNFCRRCGRQRGPHVSEQAPLRGQTPERRASQALFDQLDTNHDGVVSRAEFEAAMRAQAPKQAMGAPPAVPIRSVINSSSQVIGASGYTPYSSYTGAPPNYTGAAPTSYSGATPAPLSTMSSPGTRRSTGSATRGSVVGGSPMRTPTSASPSRGSSPFRPSIASPAAEAPRANIYAAGSPAAQYNQQTRWQMMSGNRGATTPTAPPPSFAAASAGIPASSVRRLTMSPGRDRDSSPAPASRVPTALPPRVPSASMRSQSPQAVIGQPLLPGPPPRSLSPTPGRARSNWQGAPQNAPTASGARTPAGGSGVFVVGSSAQRGPAPVPVALPQPSQQLPAWLVGGVGPIAGNSRTTTPCGSAVAMPFNAAMGGAPARAITPQRSMEGASLRSQSPHSASFVPQDPRAVVRSPSPAPRRVPVMQAQQGNIPGAWNFNAMQQRQGHGLVASLA